MKALLDWIDAVPPLTIAQFVVIVVPFLAAQTLVLTALFMSEPFWRRRLPAVRRQSPGKSGGPDG